MRGISTTRFALRSIRTRLGEGVEWRNHHGSEPGKSSDASTSGGNHMHRPPGRTRKPGRDSSQGLLIASGMFDRRVPGSHASAYVGSARGVLKLSGEDFKTFG